MWDCDNRQVRVHVHVRTWVIHFPFILVNSVVLMVANKIHTQTSGIAFLSHPSVPSSYDNHSMCVCIS